MVKWLDMFRFKWVFNIMTYFVSALFSRDSFGIYGEMFVQFYPSDAMLARVLAVIMCVCLSVCLSHAGIVSKQLNVWSRKQRHVIAQGL